MNKNLQIVIYLLFVFILQINAEQEETVLKHLQQPNYNINQSIFTSRLAFMAFCPASCLSSWTCKWSKQIPLKEVQYVADALTLTAGFVGYHQQTRTIYGSWRGTSNKANWYEDANFEQVRYMRCANCFIHTGFYTDFLLFQDRVNQRVQLILQKYPVDKIVITGHSLGGALSTIVGIQLKLRFPNYFVQIHNFGSPRVGNPSFAQFVMAKVDAIYRVVHNRDLVPHVPFTPLNYAHPAYQIFFDPDMKNYTVCNSSGQDSKCSNSFFPNYNPDDHDFYFYRNNGEGC